MINEDILKGKWKQLKGNIKKQWGKLSDDELDQIEGDQEQLEGKLQEHYGYTKEKAKDEVDRWVKHQ